MAWFFPKPNPIILLFLYGLNMWCSLCRSLGDGGLRHLPLRQSLFIQETFRVQTRGWKASILNSCSGWRISVTVFSQHMDLQGYSAEDEADELVQFVGMTNSVLTWLLQWHCGRWIDERSRHRHLSTHAPRSQRDGSAHQVVWHRRAALKVSCGPWNRTKRNNRWVDKADARETIMTSRMTN